MLVSYLKKGGKLADDKRLLTVLKKEKHVVPTQESFNFFPENIRRSSTFDFSNQSALSNSVNPNVTSKLAAQRTTKRNATSVTTGVIK